MKVTTLATNGNSAKFNIQTKRGDFTIALSFTLRTRIWELAGADAELAAATELAEAIVSRHDPKLPFRKVYIFAEHNSEPSFEKSVQAIRKYGFERKQYEEKR